MEENKSVVQASQLTNLAQTFDSQSFIIGVKDAIKSGEVNPLAIYTVLKRMSKVSEEIFKDKDIKDLALNELDKYLVGNIKSVDLYSAKICRAATHTFYDFSECGHEVLNKLYEIQEQVKNEIKNIEEELKLMIPDERKQTLGFGIENNNKDIVMSHMPMITMEEYGNIVSVKPPKKIQTMGMKFMKV